MNSKFTSILLIVALGASSVGCATDTSPFFTCRLWENATFESFYEPASPANLEVYRSLKPQDLLVTYDESHESRDKIRRRAFYLNASLERVNQGRKPHFVSPRKAVGLATVAVIPEAEVQSVATTNGFASISISADGQRLMVRDPDGEKVEFRLPTYPAASGPALRVALTPLAVVGDTVLVASVVGIVFAYAWVSTDYVH